MLFLKDARELRFVRVNRAGERIMGHPRADMLGKNDYDFFPKDQADFFTQKDRDVLQGGQPVDIPEEPIQTWDKGERYLHTRKVPVLDARGQPEYLLGISEDITERKAAEAERKQMQNQLIQMQKIESIGRLAGGVAHDFNNMLQVILGHVELALDRIDPGGQRLHADLLEIQRPPTAPPSSPASFWPSPASRPQRPRCSTSTKPSRHAPDAPPPHRRRRRTGLAARPATGPVKADPSQVDQILANLCVNARDAMPHGGTLTIETAPATFDDAHCARHSPDHRPGDYLRLAVGDGHRHGQGNPRQDLRAVFHHQGFGQNSGLGLATVYGIVKQNNGFIDV
jgi:two-component system, cell cycle sensor histidine kinase and response regulator CckA